MSEKIQEATKAIEALAQAIHSTRITAKEAEKGFSEAIKACTIESVTQNIQIFSNLARGNRENL